MNERQAPVPHMPRLYQQQPNVSQMRCVCVCVGGGGTLVFGQFLLASTLCSCHHSDTSQPWSPLSTRPDTSTTTPWRVLSINLGVLLHYGKNSVFAQNSTVHVFAGLPLMSFVIAQITCAPFLLNDVPNLGKHIVWHMSLFSGICLYFIFLSLIMDFLIVNF